MVSRETMMRWIAAALAPVERRLAMLLGRGVLMALEVRGGLLVAQVQGLPGEVLAGREYVQDYGLSSRPHPGAEALGGYLAGLRSNGVVIRIFDRRHFLGLEYGEVAIHDDLGQKVHLTRTGIEAVTSLDGLVEVGGDLVVRAGGKLLLEGEDVVIRGRRSVMRDVGGYAERLTLVSEGQLVSEVWQEPAVVTAVPDHGYPAPAEAAPYG